MRLRARCIAVCRRISRHISRAPPPFGRTRACELTELGRKPTSGLPKPPPVLEKIAGGRIAIAHRIPERWWSGWSPPQARRWQGPLDCERLAATTERGRRSSATC